MGDAMDRIILAAVIVLTILYRSSNGMHITGLGMKPPTPLDMSIGRYRDEHSPFTPQ